MFNLLVKVNQKYLKEYSIFGVSLVAAMSLYASIQSLSTYLPKILPQALHHSSWQFLLLGNQFFIFFLTLSFILFVYPLFLDQLKNDLKIFFLLGAKKKRVFCQLLVQQSLFLSSSLVASFLLSGFVGKILGQFLLYLMDIPVPVPFLYQGESLRSLSVLFIFLFVAMAGELGYFLTTLSSVHLLKIKCRASTSKKEAVLGGVGLAFFGVFLFVFAFAKETLQILRQFSWPFDGAYLFLGAFLLGMFSIYLFYHRTLSYLVRRTNSKPEKRFTQKRLFLLEIVGERMQQGKWLFTGLTLLAACSFTLMGLAYLVSSEAQQQLKQSLPIDFQVAKESEGELLNLIKKNNFSLEKKVTTPYKIKVANLPFRFSTRDKFQESYQGYNFLAESDYQKLLFLNDAKRVTVPLKKGQGYYLIEKKAIFDNLIQQASKIQIDKQTLQLKKTRNNASGTR